jgi:nucleolar protein 15
VEEGLRDFFSQYGDVLRVKLMRSKKTARSKGYCFIEFRDAEVGKIAAESMNGYLMYGRPLEARYIESHQRNKFQLIRAEKKFKFVPWQVIYRSAVNKVE